MKYPQDPEKFYNSEEQLNTIIQSLGELTQDDLPNIIESKIILTLLKILQHPNIDLAVSVIEFLFEIFEEEPAEDKDDQLFEIYFRSAIWLI